MKALSPALIILACLAHGQTGAQYIQDAMTPLRAAGSAWIKLDGTEYLDGNPTTLTLDLYFVSQMSSGPERIMLESIEYRGLDPTQRIVGDSVSLWAYDPQRKEYSASLYGAYNGPPPANYRSNLLASYELNLKGTSTYAGRLLREVYAYGGPQYRDWLPPAPDWYSLSEKWPKVFRGGQTYLEPIFARPYRSGTGPNGEFVYVAYQATAPAQKSIVFELVKPIGSTEFSLRTVFVAEKNKVGPRQRAIDASITFYPNMVPSSANFVFQPPAGSRAVAGPKPSGGN